MTIAQLVQREIQRLLTEKSRLENLMSSLPDGSLIITRTRIGRRTYHKWYSSTPDKDGKKVRQYIPKAKKTFARDLARKKLYEKQLEEIVCELNALNSYLSKHRTGSAQKALFDDPVLMDLLKKEPAVPEDSMARELKKWMNESYEKNPKHPENLIVPSVTGEMVRSKSEAMILMLLEYYGIPYRYECRLDMGGKVYYPDFTIRHPVTGEFFYWEHAGMLDTPSYRSDFINKLNKYINNSILPDHNLILTYESSSHPFDIKIARDKIREFLLYDEMQLL